MYDLVLFLWGKEDTEARQGVVAYYGMAKLLWTPCGGDSMQVPPSVV